MNECHRVGFLEVGIILAHLTTPLSNVVELGRKVGLNYVTETLVPNFHYIDCNRFEILGGDSRDKH